MIGGQLPPRPSEALAGHLWVCPFPEDDVHELIGAIGADHVLFGSDYPHPEGGSAEGTSAAARGRFRAVLVAKVGCDAVMVRQLGFLARADAEQFAPGRMPCTASPRPGRQHVVEPPVREQGHRSERILV